MDGRSDGTVSYKCLLARSKHKYAAKDYLGMTKDGGAYVELTNLPLDCSFLLEHTLENDGKP